MFILNFKKGYHLMTFVVLYITTEEVEMIILDFVYAKNNSNNMDKSN